MERPVCFYLGSNLALGLGIRVFSIVVTAPGS